MQQQVLDFSKYPKRPGWKRRGTSSTAANKIKPFVTGIRAEVLRALREHGPLTADEVAVEIGRTPFSVRPRLSELLKMGLIEDAGHTRLNDSGVFASVWRAK